ncbi:hypothetical protein AVEN_215946-1 [Araneus ventricosus]|uniref:Uncharacterized protein n=1 Tax=Araneus ventricosus TaxID=182803 RepID=A0A4Y2HHA5_ARAVE|nr:hypothetical protein AVEN_215946-1 [Araneus ventricosus]
MHLIPCTTFPPINELGKTGDTWKRKSSFILFQTLYQKEWKSIRAFCFRGISAKGDEERFEGCPGNRTGAARSVSSSDDTICRRQSATDWTARNDRSFLLLGLRSSEKIPFFVDAQKEGDFLIKTASDQQILHL